MNVLLGQQEFVERMPVNPLDKSTVVSIFPQDIEVRKATIQPSDYKILAGTFDNPAVLVVESASWWRRAVDMPSTEIPTGSMQVAKSIAEDYVAAMIESEPGIAEIGLFWVPGNNTASEVKTKFASKLEHARAKQNAWFANLVKRADIDWSRTGGNPMVVTALSKLAAEHLQLKDKPWMKDFNTMSMVNCPACGVLKNPAFPICANCKTNIPEWEKSVKK